MNILRHSALAAVLVGGSALFAVTPSTAQPPRPAQPPRTAKQAAPIDFTGQWVSIVTEDWRFRMVTPPKGDYPGAQLSPAGEATPRAPVYLLHGTDDNVIPAVESFLLADTLRGRGVTVHQLATPLITHAEVDRSATLSAMFRLVGFWENLLGE